MKWEAVIEGISSIYLNYNNEDSGDSTLEQSILGKGFAQFMLAWKTALPAGMNAVRGALTELHDSDSNEVAFDKCWSAAQKAAFTSLKEVIEATSPQVNRQRSTELWNKIFEVWDKCWVDTCPVVKQKCLAILEEIVDEIVKTGTVTVIQGIKDQNANTLQACLTQVGSSSYYLSYLRLVDDD